LVDSNQVVSANELAKMKFSTLILRGKFARLPGKPYIPFYLMIYGQWFHGRSFVPMQLADIPERCGLKVLYVSNEEGMRGLLQEKLLRLQITSPIDFVENFDPAQFKGYNAVFCTAHRQKV